MSDSTHNLKILVYDATLNYSKWAALSFTVAADNSVTGSFEYIGATMVLTGKRNPPGEGSQDNYELNGEDVRMRISAYPAFGGQFPVAGVASINEAGPFYIIGKQS